jgi:hypothetical protein
MMLTRKMMIGFAIVLTGLTLFSTTADPFPTLVAAVLVMTGAYVIWKGRNPRIKKRKGKRLLI